GIFDQGRYFDVVLEYAKREPEDLLIRISISNRGPEAATIQVLPTLWFRNTWSWGRDPRRPSIVAGTPSPPTPLPQGERSQTNLPSPPRGEGVGVRGSTLLAKHWQLGEYILYCSGADELLFTENETNSERLFRAPSPTPYVKDAFHAYVVNGKREAVNPARTGTKAAARYSRTIEAGQTITLNL